MREEKYIENKREKREEIGERRMGLSPIGEALTDEFSCYPRESTLNELIPCSIG